MNAKKPKVQEMSLLAINADHALQSRVWTNPEAVREYAEALVAGSIFPPVVIFFDGTTNWLADGFHRYAAFWKTMRASIPAEVREGTRRDALIYSAGANAKMGMRPTVADKRKAAFMLLGDVEWFDKADSLIGAHCGVQASTIKNYRAEYCTENDIPFPDRVRVDMTDSRGDPVTRPYVQKPPGWEARERKRRREDGVAALKEISEAFGEEEVRTIYDDLEGPIRTGGEMVQALRAFGVRARLPDRGGYPSRSLPAGILLDGAACVLTPELDIKNLPETIGRALLFRMAINERLRAIVITRFEDEAEDFRVAMRLARRLGVEFMTPSEVVAEFGPKT